MPRDCASHSMPHARRSIPSAPKAPFAVSSGWSWRSRWGIYYLAPWIRWDRGPHAPDQAILLDLANRRFYFFFIEIWPQEFYFVAGLLIMAGLGLFLVTTAVGRAWCGYTCPQTVWVDLFLVVERAVEGDRNARHQARFGALDARQDLEANRQARRLAADRHGHRRRLGLLFRQLRPSSPMISPHSRRRPSHT